MVDSVWISGKGIIPPPLIVGDGMLTRMRDESCDRLLCGGGRPPWWCRERERGGTDAWVIGCRPVAALPDMDLGWGMTTLPPVFCCWSGATGCPDPPPLPPLGMTEMWGRRSWTWGRRSPGDWYELYDVCVGARCKYCLPLCVFWLSDVRRFGTASADWSCWICGWGGEVSHVRADGTRGARRSRSRCLESGARTPLSTHVIARTSHVRVRATV